MDSGAGSMKELSSTGSMKVVLNQYDAINDKGKKAGKITRFVLKENLDRAFVSYGDPKTKAAKRGKLAQMGFTPEEAQKIEEAGLIG